MKRSFKSDRVIGLCGGWLILHANDFELKPCCSGEKQFREVTPRNDVGCSISTQFFSGNQDTRQVDKMLVQLVLIGL